jgi:hypothetical protein
MADKLESTAQPNLNQQPRLIAIGPLATTATSAQVFHSGKFRLRDGDKFGQSPYYVNPQTGKLQRP